MTTDLAVIIPSRGRPGDVARTAEAFKATGADDVPVIYAVEDNDPTIGDYRDAVDALFGYGEVLAVVGRAMAPSINLAARHVVADLNPYALAVLNDDHVPATDGWAGMLVSALRNFSPAVGMTYPDDGYQGPKLSTAWAVTSSWVTALGRMIPARVGHLFADNAVMDLAAAARCMTYMPAVRIPHHHPAAGLAEWTSQYREVNSRERYAADRAIFRHWQGSAKRRAQLAALREVIARG
jgi:hypothetical protein